MTVDEMRSALLSGHVIRRGSHYAYGSGQIHFNCTIEDCGSCEDTFDSVEEFCNQEDPSPWEDWGPRSDAPSWLERLESKR